LRRGDKLGVAAARGNLIGIAMFLGDLDTAQQLATVNLDAEREIGNLRCVAMTLRTLGEIQMERGDAADAAPLINESLRICRQIGDVINEAFAVCNLGQVALLNGDPVEAYRQIADGIRLVYESGNRGLVANALNDLAGLLSTAEPVRAARLIGAADAIRE